MACTDPSTPCGEDRTREGTALDTPDTSWLRLVRGPDLREHRLSELWGWLQGISACAMRGPNGAAEALTQWLERCEEVSTVWPAHELYGALCAAQEQIHPTHRAAHRARVIHAFTEHMGLWDTERWRSTRARFAHMRPEDLHFHDAHMVFTGELVSCTREQAEQISTALGARVRHRVAQCGDYLVAGPRPSPGWKRSNCGRKIEQIERWQHDGKTACRIVNEETWARAVLLHHNAIAHHGDTAGGENPSHPSTSPCGDATPSSSQRANSHEHSVLPPT